MGNLSNLFVSKSFQSLIHLATDNTASANLIGLEDGFGNSIGVSVNTAGDLSLSGSLTASLQNGYVWVGNASGKTTTVPTSSFGGGGGSVPPGTISGSAQITAFGFVSGSYETTGRNIISSSAQITSLGFVSSSVTASSLITASFDNGTRNLTFTKGDASTFAVNIPDLSGSGALPSGVVSGSSQINYPQISNIPAGIVSGAAQITPLLPTGVVSGSTQVSSITGSSLITASVAPTSNTIRFTKGDNTTFDVTLNITSSATASFDTGSFATTGSNSFIGNQTITGSINVSGSARIVGPTSITGSLQLRGDGSNDVVLSRGTNQSQFSLATFDAGLVLGSNGTFNVSSATGTQSTLKIDSPTNNGRANINLDASGVGGNDIISISARGTNNTASLWITDANTDIPLMIFEQNPEKATIYNQLVVSGSVIITGSLTSSLQQGHVFVGNASGITTTVPTSSFGGGSVPAGTISSSAQITELGFVSSSVTASSIITASAVGNTITFTKGDASTFNVSVTSTPIDTASFATTGSNTFTGAQTIQSDVAINNGRISLTGQTSDGPIWVLGQSGSLVLTNNATTPTYASLSHIISSQPNANTNIVFKNNTGNPTTIVSGSGNIFSNQANVTAGFNRYIGGSQNVFAAALPQLTGSAAFSPVISSNFSSTGIIMRTPVSASAYTIGSNVLLGFGATAVQLGINATNNFERATNAFTLNNNVIAGNLNAIAFKTPLSASITITNNNIGGTAALNMDSSSINMNGSTIQGLLSVNNSYFPSTINANSVLNVNGNLSIGSHTIFASGSNTTFTAGRNIQNVGLIGAANVLSASLNGDNSNVYSTMLFGQGLVAVGTNTRQVAQTMPDYGTVFVGRWNDINGTRDMTAETVFAVGTGTSETNRKTALLIDSGSNTFVEGTLNVSGATSLNGNLTITGSLTSSLQQGYVWVGNASGQTTTVPTSSFGGGGSTFPYTGTAEITGSLIVSASFPTPIDFRVGTIEMLADSVTIGRFSGANIDFGLHTTINSGGDFIVNVGADCKFNSDDIQLIGGNPFFRFTNTNGGEPLAIRSYQNLLTVENLNDTSRLAQFNITGTTLSGSVGHSITGSTSILGNLTIQSGSGDLYVHGHKQFNCGAFQSNVTQSGSANVSQSVQFDTTDVSYGVTLQSGSQLLVANSGTYLVTFSAQVLADAGADVIYLWLKKNGTNVPESASKLNLQNNAAQLATVTFVVDAVANDYYEIAWQTTNGDAVLYTEAASGNIPAIPSIIATITQVR